MKSKNQTLSDDEIDLKEIILTLWKEKFLILIITLIFTVAGFIYGTLKPKVFETLITLRLAPEVLFEKYRPFIAIQQQQQQQQQQQISIASNFNKMFKLNLLSFDSLTNFVEQNKKLDEFKSYLKKNNIDVRSYFRGEYRLEPVIVPKKKNKYFKENQYSLILSKSLPYDEFLNDYFIFIKKKTESEFKEEMIDKIVVEIEIYKQNLEIAKKIDLQNPMLKSIAEGYSSTAEPNALFYKGSKVLSQQLIYLEKLLEETKKLNLNYNPILEKASSPIIESQSIVIFISFAFFLGLFLSLIFIFLKSFFFKKNARFLKQ
jgi:LPS O-antigen subunit length determinant protein (WzzB/FepE family)